MQDEAGAPLTTAADPTPSTPAPVPTGGRRRLYAVLLGLAAVVLVLDQATKVWALRRADARGRPSTLIGSFIRLNLIRNPGAAFSIGDGSTWLLTAVSIGILVWVVIGARKVGNMPWAVALGLLLGGALGNLVDRVFRAPGPGPRARRRLHRLLRPVHRQRRGHRDRRGRRHHHGALLPRHLPRRARCTTPSTPMTDARTVLVPDGLEGERVDSAIARLFGLSRTRAADLAAGGGRQRQRRQRRQEPPGQRRRHARGAAPGLPGQPDPRGRGRAGARHERRLLRRGHRRGRQAGRRRGAPERRLDRPERARRPQGRRLPHLDQRGQRAPGHRLAARRGHLGPDGGLRERARLLGAQAGLQGAPGRQDVPHAGAGPARPARRHHRRADRAATRATTTSSRSWTPASTP